MSKPQIRFKGFEDEWQRLPLYSCGTFNPKTDLPSTFEYVDLESVVGTVMTRHRTEDKSSAPSRAQRLARKGDIFYQTVRPYQKNNLLFELEENNYVFSTGYAQIRPIINGRFLFSILQKDSFVNEVLLNCTGTSYPAINSTVLSELLITKPDSEEEQANIGDYFKQIDEMISEVEREVDRLEKMKQASLQKMFPRPGATAPEIRFNGFSSKWRKCKLSELLTQRIEHQKITDEEPLLAFSYAEGVINPDDKKSNKRDFLMTDKFNKIFSRTEVDDIIYNPANVIHGAIHRNTLKTGVVSPIYKIFRCNEDISPKYMGVRLRTSSFISEIFKYIEGTVIKLRTLSPYSFLNMEIDIPESIAEQDYIGEYFYKLDNLISAKRQKLVKLRDIKQACLDKMFVNTSDL